jgi:hypothetical protein
MVMHADEWTFVRAWKRPDASLCGQLIFDATKQTGISLG